MTFLEALEQSLNGETIISVTGKIYSPKKLNVQRLGREAYVMDGVTSKEEKKGEWQVLSNK